MLTIGLLWHSPNSDNLGVGALTLAHIAVLEDVARQLETQVRFKVLCWEDPAPHYVTGEGVEVYAMRARDLIDPRCLLATVLDCDMVLDISAGDSFADIYGVRRFLFNALAKMNVLVAGRPLLLSPQTIGPFHRWWTRLLAVQLMKRAKAVVTRDQLSSEYVKQLGLEHKLLESTDLAFRLPYTRPDRSFARGRVVRVGLNLSGLLFNGGYSRKNMFKLKGDYPSLARALCAHFTGLPACELHLVGHVNSHFHAVEDDFRLAELLAHEFPTAIVAPRFAGPSDAKAYISQMDFFAGSRMHACIAAFAAGVPVLPIAYSRKFAGVFGTLGYRHGADCRTQSNEEVFGAVLDAFKRREELERDVRRSLERVDYKLASYEKVIIEALRGLSGR